LFAELETPRVSYFSWGNNALLALETVADADGQETDRIISIQEGRKSSDVVREFGPNTVAESLATSPDGALVAVAVSHGPGTPVLFQVSGAEEWMVRPPGTLVGEPSPLPDGSGLVYENHDAGSVDMITRDGIRSELVHTDASWARVSSRWVLAYATLEPAAENRVRFASLKRS